MHDTIADPFSGVAVCLHSPILAFQVDIAEDDVAAWDGVAASEFHGLLALCGPADVPVHDLAYFHS